MECLCVSVIQLWPRLRFTHSIYGRLRPCLFDLGVHLNRSSTQKMRLSDQYPLIWWISPMVIDRSWKRIIRENQYLCKPPSFPSNSSILYSMVCNALSFGGRKIRTVCDEWKLLLRIICVVYCLFLVQDL